MSLPFSYLFIPYRFVFSWLVPCCIVFIYSRTVPYLLFRFRPILSCFLGYIKKWCFIKHGTNTGCACKSQLYVYTNSIPLTLPMMMGWKPNSSLYEIQLWWELSLTFVIYRNKVFIIYCFSFIIFFISSSKCDKETIVAWYPFHFACCMKHDIG